jgi:hypothetical protein
MADISQALGHAFDSTQVEPNEPRGGVLPAGEYTFEIVAAEVKPTKAGDGTILAFSLAVIDPAEFAKRRVFENLCIVHPKQQTQEIAQAQLSSLCRALGISQLKDTDELLGRVVRARIKVRPPANGYDESNAVVAYEAAHGAVPPGPKAPSPAPAGKTATPPWQKKAA